MSARQQDIGAALVRIKSTTDQTAGLGVLIGTHEVVTCAHVVNAALGRRDHRDSAPPDAAVRVQVEFIQLDAVRRATVVAWQPPAAQGVGGDVAGLRLGEAAPAGSMVAELAREDALPGARLRTFGYPEEPSRPQGVTVLVEAKAGRNGTVQQVDSVVGEAIKVQPGFSGSPVCDDLTGLVVGIITGSAFPEEEGRDAYLIPSGVLAEVWEEPLDYVRRPANPYRGLQPFTEHESDLFFGREEDVAELATLVAENRVVAVVGASGVGKSSLVRAGLLPYGGWPAGVAWTPVVFRPTPYPWTSMAHQLAVAVTGDSDPPFDQERAIEQQLRADGIKPIAAYFAARDRPLMLVVDQFEELFTESAQLDENLIEMLIPAEDSPDLGIRIVLTIRLDFFESWSAAAGGDRLSRQQIFLLRPLTRQQRFIAIEKPARARKVEYQDGLVAKIVEQTTDDSLPLLQFILVELWETQSRRLITHARFDELGGLAGFVDTFAERQVSLLRPTAEAALEDVLLSLVKTSGHVRGKRVFVRGRVDRSQADAEQWRILERLAAARLVNIQTAGLGEAYAELAHERLITAWGRLERISTANAAFLEWLSGVEDRAAQDDLLSQARILESRRWLDQQPHRVPSAIVDFVSRSEEAERERVRTLTDALDRATALRLASEGELTLRSSRPRVAQALALGIESLLTTQTPQGAAAVRHALSIHRRVVLQVHETGSCQVAFSPDGRLLAIAGQDGLLRLHRARDGGLLSTAEHDGPVNEVVFSGSGTTIVTASADQHVRLFQVKYLADDTVTLTSLDSLRHARRVTTVALSSDGNWIGSGGRDSAAQLLNLDTGSLRHLDHPGKVNKVALSQDGELFVTGCSDGGLRIFQTSDGALQSQAIQPSPVGSISISPDSRYVASARQDGTVRVLHMMTGEAVLKASHPQAVWVVQFDPDGKTLATACEDGIVRLFDMSSGAEISRMIHSAPVLALTFGSSSSLLLTGCEDGSARAHHAPSGRMLIHLDHDSPVRSVALGMSDHRLAIGTLSDGTLLYDAEPSGAEMQSTLSPSPVLGVTAAGRTLAAACEDGIARAFDLAGAQPPIEVVHDARVTSVAVAAEGSVLATGCEDGTARIWALPVGHEQRRVTHQAPVRTVDLSSDGDFMISGAHDGIVKLVGPDGFADEMNINAAIRKVALYRHLKAAIGLMDGRVLVRNLTDRTTTELTHHSLPISGLQWTPDGARLAVAASDRTAQIVDVATGAQMTVIHDSAVIALAVSPDGRLVATGSIDQTARVFDALTGENVMQLDLDGPVHGVTFAPDSCSVVCSIATGSISSYETDLRRLCDRALLVLPRPLTNDEQRRFTITVPRHLGAWQRLRSHVGRDQVEGSGDQL